MKKKNYLILNSISLVLCALLLVFSIFAWYSSNREVKAMTTTLVSSEDSKITFTELVYAERHSLNGDVIYNTYTRTNDGDLYLTKSVTYPKGGTATTETFTVAEKKPFHFNDMLPGEYVDVTIGFSMDEKFDNQKYSVELRQFSAGSFYLDGKMHYVSGAYKFRNISLTYGDDDTACADFTADTEDTWLMTYDLTKDDDPLFSIPTLSHTWKSDYEVLNYTFRITEDFSQYYKILGQATVIGDEEETGNLLSKKTMKIGQLFIQV